MASNPQFEQDHSELDPRALVDPQTFTGMPPVSGGDQRRIRPSTGVESDDQARTRGMDPDGTSQPGRELKWSCPGCGGKPGNTNRYSLCGEEKTELRTFVREKRRRFLEKMGISHTPNSADVSLERMNICDTCRRSFAGSKVVKLSGSSQIYKPESGNIELAIPRLPNTTKNCVFGEKASPLRSIPVRDRFKVLISHRLYIPPDARCCDEHLERGEWAYLARNSEIKLYSPTQIQEMVDLVINNYSGPSFLDFEFVETMGDKAVHDWTGLTIAQFNQLFSSVSSLEEKEKTRPKTALGLWLAKARTGETNERLATLVDLTRSRVETLMGRARECLGCEWVPQHLGFTREGSPISREFLKSHMTAVTTELFCAQDRDRVVVVLDGTYIYIQKSSNYAFQRRNYSGHKHRPLLKPMMVVAPDGHIIDTIGPYSANDNDAAIIKSIGDNLMQFLREGDVVLVDRGFRDAVAHLTALGLDVQMPALKSGPQLDTEQANRTRLITSCRWIVEARNGHLKQCYRQFDKVWPNKSISHMMLDFRIASAILNVFHPNIIPRDGFEKATSMLAKVDKRNTLATLVADENLNRKSVAFMSIDGASEEELEFPQLTEADLRSITQGDYHLRLARSYYAEHVKANGVYEVQVAKHIGPIPISYGLSVGTPVLIRGKIQSRHTSSKQYFVYILLDLDELGVDSVSSYTCSCPQGLRTVGCCAHVATVLWYLGYARHLPEISIPAEYLNDVCVELEGQE